MRLGCDGAVIVRKAPAVIGVIGIRMTAPLIIGSQRIGGLELPRAIPLGQTGLLPIRPGHPPEKMVERAVFHHEQNNMLNILLARRRRARRDAPGQRSGGARQVREHVAASDPRCGG
jgi:hypothetical protein